MQETGSVSHGTVSHGTVSRRLGHQRVALVERRSLLLSSFGSSRNATGSAAMRPMWGTRLRNSTSGFAAGSAAIRGVREKASGSEPRSDSPATFARTGQALRGQRPRLWRNASENRAVRQHAFTRSDYVSLLSRRQHFRHSERNRDHESKRTAVRKDEEAFSPPVRGQPTLECRL